MPSLRNTPKCFRLAKSSSTSLNTRLHLSLWARLHWTFTSPSSLLQPPIPTSEMLAPRTIHTHRTYIHPTTSKKNVNKENDHALPSKTPSRMSGKQLIGPATGMRMGLGVKTEGRDRNVLQQQVEGKAKGREVDEIEPKRLFVNSSKDSIPPSKSLSSMPPIPSLPTRTPAPRRNAPSQSQTLRTPAPTLKFAEPQPTPLPSAARTRRRSRQSLSNTPGKGDLGLDKQRGQQFVTPAPVKWEEELSLGSVEVEHLEGLEELEEEEDGEPEYMPPPVQELPYDPGWDVPDLKEIFGKIATMPLLFGIGNEMPKPPELIFQEEEVGLRLCNDDDLEEDWLKPQSRLAPKTVGSAFARPTTTRPKTTPATRAPTIRSQSSTSNSNSLLKPARTQLRSTVGPAATSATKPSTSSIRGPVRSNANPVGNIHSTLKHSVPTGHKSALSSKQAAQTKAVIRKPVDPKDQAILQAWEDDVRQLEASKDSNAAEGLFLNLDLDLKTEMDVGQPSLAE
ncbi:hypothetical protein AYX15_03088 [Cryptococcus neoformans]|nr:hypothetical protein AYX15_03088 [Cryptococcus neoformans var. grubii]